MPGVRTADGSQRLSGVGEMGKKDQGSGSGSGRDSCLGLGSGSSVQGGQVVFLRIIFESVLLLMYINYR